MNTRVGSAPDGESLWASHALLEAVHHIRVARTRRLAERTTAARLPALADQGHTGLAPKVVVCPVKSRDKPWWKKDATPAHARLHAPGERAITQLKNRHIPHHMRCRPTRSAKPSERYWPSNPTKQDEKG